MFGHQDDQQGQQNTTAIPEQSIDGVLSAGDQQWQHPGVPLDTTPSAAATVPFTAPVDAPMPDAVAPAATSDVTQPTQPVQPAATNDLLDIKQQALNQLSPLVGHLEQSPEEKFRTTMMMIQASDNQSLIQVAYQAAQAITDEKMRAQALLDIVNEINYFTQQPAEQ